MHTTNWQKTLLEMMDRLTKLSTTHGILPHKCRCNPVSKYTGHASTRVCLLAYLPACLPAGLCTCRPAYLPAWQPAGLFTWRSAYMLSCLPASLPTLSTCRPTFMPACLPTGLLVVRSVYLQPACLQACSPAQSSHVRIPIKNWMFRLCYHWLCITSQFSLAHVPENV